MNTVCLNMIVKNESRVIARALDSVIPHIDTWCIIDTGSSDDTIAIIESKLSGIPGKVYRRPWINFGANRTEAFELARGMADWVLTIDADMELKAKDIKSSLSLMIDGYLIEQRSTSMSYQNIRILNSAADWKSIGATHEYFDIDYRETRTATLPEAFILDHGDGGSKSDKFTRDISLLTESLEKDPLNARNRFYLAQSYYDTRDYVSAETEYHKCIAVSQWDEELWYSQFKLGMCAIQLEKHSRVIESSMFSAWMQRPTRIEPIFELAMYFKGLHMWQQAYSLLKICNSTRIPLDRLFIHTECYGPRVKDELAIAAYWIKEYEEAFYLVDALRLNSKYYSQHRARLNDNRRIIVSALGYPTKNEDI